MKESEKPQHRRAGQKKIKGSRTGTRGQKAARSVGGKQGAYHHGDLRRKLLDRGLALIARDGLASFSLRSLAKELGVSHAAPYRHFSSREELLAEIVRESMDSFEKALLASVVIEGDNEENLYRLGEAYVRFYLANPEILTLFNILNGSASASQSGLFTVFRAKKMEGNDPYRPSLEEDHGFLTLRRAASAFLGKYPGLSERDVLLGFWAKAHGLACLLVSNPDWFAPEDINSGLARVIRRAF
jgi:AcrR family transcriptional regulator